MTLSSWDIPRAGAGPSVRGAANDALYWVTRRPEGAFLCRTDGARLALDLKASVGISTTTNTAIGPTTVDAVRNAWLAAGTPPGELPPPSAQWRNGQALPEWFIRRAIWWTYARPEGLPFESVVFDNMRDPARYGEALGAGTAAAPGVVCAPVSPRAPRDVPGSSSSSGGGSSSSSSSGGGSSSSSSSGNDSGGGSSSSSSSPWTTRKVLGWGIAAVAGVVGVGLIAYGARMRGAAPAQPWRQTIIPPPPRATVQRPARTGGLERLERLDGVTLDEIDREALRDQRNYLLASVAGGREVRQREAAADLAALERGLRGGDGDAPATPAEVNARLRWAREELARQARDNGEADDAPAPAYVPERARDTKPAKATAKPTTKPAKATTKPVTARGTGLTYAGLGRPLRRV